MQETAAFLKRIIVGTAALALATQAWAFAQPLPETNIMALFGIGSVGFILFIRHKRKKLPAWWLCTRLIVAGACSIR